MLLVHVRSECELQFVRFRPSRGGMAGPVKSYTEGTAFSIVDIRTLLGDPNHSHSEVNALGVTPVRNTTAIVSDETNVPRSCGSAQGDGWSGQYPAKSYAVCTTCSIVDAITLWCHAGLGQCAFCVQDRSVIVNMRSVTRIAIRAIQTPRWLRLGL